LEPLSEANVETSSILIVDDNEAICRLLETTLRSDGTRLIETASTAAEAKECLRKRRFDVVITDISMPDEDGISLMQWASEHTPGASWMVLTGHATVDTAVRALQLGAFDFITKPLESLAGLKNKVNNALEHRRLVAEHAHLHSELEQRNTELQANVNQLEAACHLLAEQADTIAVDLRRAALIQQALLPQVAPRLERMSVNALYRPSQDVGGDLYDVVRLDERHLVLLIADAAGHGLSAAMLAVLFRNRLTLIEGHPRALPPQRRAPIRQPLPGGEHHGARVLHHRRLLPAGSREAPDAHRLCGAPAAVAAPGGWRHRASDAHGPRPGALPRGDLRRARDRDRRR